MKYFTAFAFFVVSLLSSCSPSSEDIAEELGPKIKKDICNTLKVNESEMQLVSCDLSHASGNNYNGILKTNYNGMTQSFKLNITYEVGGKYTAEWSLIKEE